jgi:membrane AbrB-like protein
LNRLTGLGWATAIISAVPGGLPAMASMAEDLDADATVVAAIHFSRLATILLVVPIVLRLLLGGWSGSAAVVSFGEPVGLGLRLLVLAVGSLGGMLALLAHVPTADLVGPILIVGGINLFGGGLGPLPAGFQQAAMLLIGISVGAQMSRESLRRLRRVALPALAMIATLITTGLLLGWGLAQVTPLDLTTALLSGVPGGASTMPLIAHDLGGDMRVVAALHLTRQLVVLVLVPAILGALLRGRQHKPVAARDLPAAGE